MISVRVHEEGATVVATEFEAMAARSENPRPAFEAINEYLSHVSHIQFDRGGQRGPHKWEPASPNTRQKKRRAGLRYKLMFATEELYSSLVQPTHPDHIFRVIGDTMMEFGSRTEQFEIHQDESAAEAGGFPWRPPVDLTVHDERRTTRYIEEYIMGSVVRRSYGL